MIPKISVCCFIRDNNVGAFALWESMASLIEFADEYIIMDCGSTDGTLETLQELERRNPKISLVHGTFLRSYDGKLDPKIFADLANDLVGLCRHDLVLYHQADEIWHENLLTLMRAELERLAAIRSLSPDDYARWPGMNFWRYQLQENFQRIKWWPHTVNRLDFKTRMVHVGDGMNTNRPADPPILGLYPSQDWQSGYADNPARLPTHQMILDVSMTGGFLENILMRRQLHAPLWNESPDVLYGTIPGGGGVNIHDWMRAQRQNPAWTEPHSPFDIPQIMRGLVGQTSYFMRAEIFERIANA